MPIKIFDIIRKCSGDDDEENLLIINEEHEDRMFMQFDSFV